MTIESNSQYEIPDHLRYQEVDGEIFLLNIETGIFFGLNEIGVAVWEQLEAQNDLGDLSKRLSAKYGVEGSVILKDINDLLEDLVKHGLIIKKAQGG